MQIITIIWTVATIVAANVPIIPSNLFITNPSFAASLSAPLWHFDAETCFPSYAITSNGSQTPSHINDFCGVLNGGLNAGCPVQNAKTESAEKNQDTTPFPTYFTVRYCEQDDSWRIVYDVFFVKDTGHPYDWEWAAIKFSKHRGGEGYIRQGIWTEQDGRHPFTEWLNVPNTFDGEDDMEEMGNVGRDHPKVYFGKWKHSVALSVDEAGRFENDCPGAIINKKDYHTNDFKFYSGNTLVKDEIVPATFDYGAADSTPMSFRDGGRYDICGSTFVSDEGGHEYVEI